MPKIYIIFCSALIVLLVVANFNGYVFMSMFSNVQKANKAANHYHK